MFKKISLAVFVFGLVGCASQPTQQEMAAADYGTPIVQADCEAKVKAIMDVYLKDPSSASYKFGTCKKAGWNSIPIMGIPKEYGYEIPVAINAKNSFGGFTGLKAYSFLIRNGSVIRKLQQDGQNMMPF